MAIETKKNNTSILYLVSTVAFILVGIVLTGIINKTRVSTDIRSRASATSGISASAVVNEIKDDGTITVDQLTFTSSPDKNMGSWSVTFPTTTNNNALVSETNVKIIIEPITLNIENHTLTAKEIKK
jgi:hypothetical protein